MVVLIVIGVIIAIFHNSKTTDKKTAANTYAVQEACDFLNKTVARRVVGDDAVRQQSTDLKGSSVNVSYCTYIGKNSSAQLIIHSPLNKAAATLNDKMFGSYQTGLYKSVKGYGDAAFWNPQNHQLDILKHHSLYVLSAGVGNDASSYDLTHAKQFADQIIDKL